MPLLSPAGRISREAFWGFALPLALMIAGYRHVLKGQENFSDQWFLLLVVLVCPAYCLLSRRLQDCGWNGLCALPVFGFAVVWLMLDLNPTLLGVGETSITKSGAPLSILAGGARYAFAAICLFAVCKAGDEHANAFGESFETLLADDALMREERIRDRVLMEYVNNVPPTGDLTLVLRGLLSEKPQEPGTAVPAPSETENSSALGFPSPERKRSGFGRR